MNFYKLFISSLFLSRRLYALMGTFSLFFFLSYALPWLFPLVKLALALFVLILLVDYLSLFLPKDPMALVRILPDRFSNGDDNPVKIQLLNRYRFKTTVSIIDEIPVQFQWRQFQLKAVVLPREKKIFEYKLKPFQRGEYLFNDVKVYAKSPFLLLIRQLNFPAEKLVRVYPSYLLLRQYELKAHSSNLVDAGARKIRKIGHSLEFEQIKEYVRGDDVRSINWKASARKAQLMVNNFSDEKSQQIYCIIDKGRVMKMPFDHMSLLDYAINATLMLSRVALIKQDRAGLISFAENTGQFLPADRKAGQMNAILESLYKQETRFLESDFEKLYALVRNRITQRSLLVLFTNFESMAGLERQLPYLRAIARTHLLLVVFFENTAIREITDAPVTNLQGLYQKTIAEKFVHEKKLMVKELRKHGIFTILSVPQDLTLNTVNKYLELKSRQAI